MTAERAPLMLFCFFFNDTATTEIYTLSLHELFRSPVFEETCQYAFRWLWSVEQNGLDRKSTRLNSSHGSISYAVFCLKKKTYATTGSRHPASCLPTLPSRDSAA